MRPVAANRSEELNNGSIAASSEVASVRKALELVRSFSLESPVWSLSNLAREHEIPKSTAFNLLRTLQSFDLVRQDRDSRNYRLGPRAMELGLVFARSNGMVASSRAILRRLADETRETTKLGVLSNGQVLIVAAVESAHQLHTRGDVGTRWALHSTGMGKAMLAALPIDDAKEILGRTGMPANTPASFTSWAKMKPELQRTAARGYSVDMDENESGVRCVAVPLVDTLRGEVAALSISAPSMRMNEERVLLVAQEAMAAARRIAAQTPGMVAGPDAWL